MIAKDLRKAIMHYLQRNPTGDEIELHSIRHKASVGKWNCKEREPSKKELELLLAEVKDVDYEKVEERFLPVKEKEEREFRRAYSPEMIQGMQDRAIQALYKGEQVPRDYLEYLSKKERAKELEAEGI